MVWYAMMFEGFVLALLFFTQDVQGKATRISNLLGINMKYFFFSLESHESYFTKFAYLYQKSKINNEKSNDLITYSF